MATSVLVVDDDASFRALASRLLVDAGLLVVGEAGSVADALAIANRIKPTGALVDIGLPDGDGFELARRLTALPWQPRVVLTSVESDRGFDNLVRRIGVRAYVDKADLPSAPLAEWLGPA